MQPCHLTSDLGALFFSTVKGEEEFQKPLQTSRTRPLRWERQLKEQQETLSPVLTTEGQMGWPFAFVLLAPTFSHSRNMRKEFDSSNDFH